MTSSQRRDEAILPLLSDDEVDGVVEPMVPLWRRLLVVFFPPRLPMSTRQSLTLSPWQKYRQFGRFPIKVLLHLFILFLLAWQVNLIASQFTPYTRACQQTFEGIFGNDQTHYAIDETIGAIKAAADKYYQFPLSSVNEWHFVGQGGRVDDGKHAPAVLRVWRNLVAPFNNTLQMYNFDPPKIVTHQYDLHNDGNLPPFDAFERGSDELRAFVYSLEKVSIDFAYINIAQGVLGTMPVMWNISVGMDLSSDGGTVHTTVDIRETILGGADLPHMAAFTTLNPFIYINVAIMVFAVGYGLLSVRELSRGFRLYKLTRTEFPKGVMLPGMSSGHINSKMLPYTSWRNVPFDVKIQFFNVWAIVGVIASVCVLFAAAFGVMASLGQGSGEINQYYHLTLGTGAFLFSLTLTRYLEFAPKLLALALTVKIAMSRVAWMVLSVFPIYAAYMLFGVVTFSRYSQRFATMDKAAVSLFALLNGDDIHATFAELELTYPFTWVTRLYVYSFVAFFITTVLNTFIFIIEDAFMAAKRWVWTDPHQAEARRPFDICELFDIIEKRKRSSRQNLQSYYKKRVASTRGASPAASVSINGDAPTRPPPSAIIPIERRPRVDVGVAGTPVRQPGSQPREPMMVSGVLDWNDVLHRPSEPDLRDQVHELRNMVQSMLDKDASTK